MIKAFASSLFDFSDPTKMSMEVTYVDIGNTTYTSTIDVVYGTDITGYYLDELTPVIQQKIIDKALSDHSLVIYTYDIIWLYPNAMAV
jgi:hypothetical protein